MGNQNKKSNLESGFTLIETLIASAIILAVVGAAYFGIELLRKGNSTSATAFEELGPTLMGANFVKLAEGADVSVYFTHLSVKSVGCTDDSPCVRQLNLSTGNLEIPTSIPSELERKELEFYRDHYATIENDIPVEIGSRNGATLYYTKPITAISMSQNSNLFVSWPLVDTSSQPFVLLTRKKSELSFVFEDITATSSPNSSSILFRTIGVLPDEETLRSLVNSFAGIYNAYDPRQSAVQYIKAIKSCKVRKTECETWAANSHLTLPIQDDHVLIELDNPSAIQLEEILPFSSGGTFPGSTTVNFFPLRTNLYKDSDHDLGISASFDVRKWAHFAHASSSVSQLVLIPLTLFQYKIEENDSKNQLIRYEYNAAFDFHKIVEIDQVKSSVIFARQIGSSSLNIFVH